MFYSNDVTYKLMNTPILFLVFNRPDTTKKVFESIKAVKPSRLYISCDGARLDNDNDKEKIKEVKEILKNIDWECQVYKRFRNKNLGCKLAVIDGINWFFDQEEEGIILEDDTLPSNSFYNFCEFMLEKYRENKVVMHIGGYKPPHIGRDNFSISFTRATHIWGWATWKDRWKYYKGDLTNVKMLKLLPEFEYFTKKSKVRKRIKILEQINNKKLDTWDYQWNFAVRTNSGLAIRPNVNLVRNIGIGHIDATHTKKNIKESESEEFNMNNLRLPPWIMPNRSLEKQFESKL